MAETEKELAIIKKDYLPLVRLKKAYERDIKKLDKKEASVAKQKVALYGVRNNGKVADAKKAKLDEAQKDLDQLKDAVYSNKAYLDTNKKRLPDLERSYQLAEKHIAKLHDDIAVTQKSINWYNKHEKN